MDPRHHREAGRTVCGRGTGLGSGQAESDSCWKAMERTQGRAFLGHRSLRGGLGDNELITELERPNQ